MKKLILIISIAFFGMLIHAQEENTGMLSLNNVDNNLLYAKLITNVSPITNKIMQACLSDSLYQEYNYDHYEALFKTETKRRKTGLILTSIGVVFVTSGAIMAVGRDEIDEYVLGGVLLIIVGVPISVIGIPMLIVGQTRRTKYKKAMEQTKRNTNFSLRTKNNGIGLVLTF